jgi:hypothetical protein
MSDFITTLFDFNRAIYTYKHSSNPLCLYGDYQNYQKAVRAHRAITCDLQYEELYYFACTKLNDTINENITKYKNNTLLYYIISILTTVNIAVLITVTQWTDSALWCALLVLLNIVTSFITMHVIVNDRQLSRLNSRPEVICVMSVIGNVGNIIALSTASGLVINVIMTVASLVLIPLHLAYYKSCQN